MKKILRFTKRLKKSVLFWVACGVLGVTGASAQSGDVIGFYSPAANSTFTAPGSNVEFTIRLYGTIVVSNILNAAFAQPEIRMEVGSDGSSSTAYATLIRSVWTGTPFDPFNRTDLTFAYTIRPGDMAQPLKVFGTPAVGLTIVPNQCWIYKAYLNGSWSNVTWKVDNNLYNQPGENCLDSGIIAQGDIDLSFQNIYLRTLSFDPAKSPSTLIARQAATTWRIKSPETNTVPVSVMVWTPHTNVLQVGSISGQAVEVTIPAGSDYVDFPIKGLDTNAIPTIATVYAQRPSDYSQNETCGVLNAISSAVAIEPPVPPTISIEFQNGQTMQTLPETNEVETGAFRIILSEPDTNCVYCDLLVAYLPSTFTNIVMTPQPGGYCVNAGQAQSVWYPFSVRNGTRDSARAPYVRVMPVATNTAKYTISSAGILNIGNIPPTVQWSPPATGDENVPVTFTWSDLRDVEADLARGIAFTWNFGDGTSITQTNFTTSGQISKTYTSIGDVPRSYTVTLTVTDADGGTTTLPSHKVLVAPAPKPAHISVVVNRADMTYQEGDATAQYTVVLSEEALQDTWVALTGQYIIDSTSSDDTLTLTNTIFISAGATSSVPCTMVLKDGTLKTSSGIKIVPSITNAAAQAQYPLAYPGLLFIENVAPGIDTVPTCKPTTSALPPYNAIEMGKPFAFRYKVSEVVADRTGVPPLRVQFQFEDGTTTTRFDISGSVTNTFTMLGAQSVTMVAQDKDGGVSTVTFEIHVIPPVPVPTVTVVDYPIIVQENDTIPKMLTIMLSQTPISAGLTSPVVVYLDVTPANSPLTGAITIPTSVTFYSTQSTKTVNFTVQDGTLLGVTGGFTITPRIVAGQPGSSVYTQFQPGQILVQNVAPIIQSPLAGSTNTVAAVGVPRVFSWSIRDVTADLPTLSLFWDWGDGTTSTTTGGSGTNAHTYFAASPQVPVYVRATDKDGDSHLINFSVIVNDSKKIIARPLGPNTAGFNGFTGLGTGTIVCPMANSSLWSGAPDYFYTFYFNLTAMTTQMLAIPSPDVPGVKKSYFFAWDGPLSVFQNPTHVTRPLAPTVTILGFPPNENTTTISAIFSLEYDLADVENPVGVNNGDINQDGIPDRVVMSHFIQPGGEENALNPVWFENLHAYNRDEDFLPVYPTGDSQGVLDFRPIPNPTTPQDVVAVNAFSAFMEIRGYDGILGTNDDPHTSPTLNDTDGDTYPDGWESWFYYQSVMSGRNGSRYNPLNIAQGDPIDWSEIACAFDPVVSRTTFPEPRWQEDFDNDGLTDSDELVLGTDPTNWDTDGDTLADGVELLRGFNPCDRRDSLSVTVADHPVIISENDTTLQQLTIVLSQTPADAGIMEPVVVYLDVTPTNSPLHGSIIIPSNITFYATQATQQVNFIVQDGTLLSASDGFTVTPRIMEGQPGAKLYQQLQPGQILVQNVAPVIVAPLDQTNIIATVEQPQTFNWSVQDAETDLADMTIWWDWGDGTTSTTTGGSGSTTHTYTGAVFPWTIVTVSATDKDGDFSTLTFFVELQCTVTLDAQGGSVSPETLSVVYEGFYESLPLPTRTGYLFKGWWTGAEGAGMPVTNQTPVMTDDNHTLYAKWEPMKYTVKLYGQGGIVLSISSEGLNNTFDLLGICACTTAVGSGLLPSTKIVTYDAPYGPLPIPEFSGYVFLGWWTSKDNGVRVTAETLVTTPEDHDLYARWKSGSEIATALSPELTELSWSSTGDESWFPQTEESHDGVSAMQSGDIGDGQSSILETTITGPARLSFWWKVSSEADGDLLQFSINGEAPAAVISGETEWVQKTVSLTAAENRVKWVYTKNSSVRVGRDCAWVDHVTVKQGVYFEQASVTVVEGSLGVNRIAEIPVFAIGPASVTVYAIPGTATTADYIWPTAPTTLTWASGVAEKKMVRIPIKTDSSFEQEEVFYLMLGAPNSGLINEQRVCAVTIKDETRADKLGDALDNLILSWTTSGTPSWTPQSAMTFDNEDAAWSGALASNKISYVKTSVTGTGTVSFAWCVRGQGTLRLLDGTQVLLAISNDTDWVAQSLRLDNNISHSLKWEYKQGGDGLGRAYLDRVVWIPGGKTAVQVNVIADSPEGGGASGSGTYIPGARIYVKAKARAGWLFTGWTSGVPLTYPLSLSQTLTVGYSNLTLTAHFVKVPVVTGLPYPPEGGKVTGTGLCLPGKSVTLKATPAAGWVLTSWSDGVQTLSRTIRTAADVTLFAAFKRIADVVPPAIGGIESQRAMVGVPFEVRFEMTSETLPAVTITGLPAGLSFTPATQSISGVPTVPVTNRMVTITAKNANPQPTTRTFLLTVDPLPVWAKGTFSGLVGSETLGSGSATMSITSVGGMAGKFTLRGTNFLFSAPAYSAREPDGSFMLITTARVGAVAWPMTLVVSQPVITDPSGIVSNTISIADGMFAGRSEQVVLYRSLWGDPGMSAQLAPLFSGYYTATLPGGNQFGSGYLTFTIDQAGLVKTVGKLADGTAISLSGALTLDESGRAWTVIYTAPLDYKGGGLFGVAEFVRTEAGVVHVQVYNSEPFVWENLNPRATGEYGAGFLRELDLVGGWYDTLGNLYRYYGYRTLSVSTENRPAPEVLVGTNRYDAACWNPDGLSLKVVTNATGVMTGLAAPLAGVPLKFWDGYHYPLTNATGLTIGFTRATGLFKGSFKAWFDYGTTHTAKTIAYEGVLTPGAENNWEHIAGRGFFLWGDTASTPAPLSPYSFNESYDLKILLSPNTAIAVDQSQTSYDKLNDFSDGIAQSFTAGCSARLAGIRLPMQRMGGPRDLTLELRHVDENSFPVGPVLATGTLRGSSVDQNSIQWYTVLFDRFYDQEAGEKLSFTMHTAFSNEPYGWIDYGYSIQNPYEAGLVYYMHTYLGWTYDMGYLDLAFETLVLRDR